LEIFRIIIYGIWKCKGSKILTCIMEFHITEYINLPYYNMGNSEKFVTNVTFSVITKRTQNPYKVMYETV